MKRIVATLLLVLTYVTAASAQTAPDAAELTKLLNDFLAGAGRNDPAAHERFWADDLIYTRSAGVRTNKAEIMKGLRTEAAPNPDAPVTVYTAEDIVIHQYGNTAIVAFKLVSTTTNKDGSKKVGNNLNTGVFMKRKGMWQVIAWQSTIVPEPKAETKPAASGVTAATNAPSSDGTHAYLKGSRGGCYYLNSGGAKTYVDHKFCN
jgi:ketosteroid isomerase-like protein